MEFLLVYQDDLTNQSPNNKNASPEEKVKKKKKNSRKGFHTRFSFPNPMNCYPGGPGP